MNDVSYTEFDRKGIRSILVPTDFLEPSDTALQIAIDLAKQQKARIYLLHVGRFRVDVKSMEKIQRQLTKFSELRTVEIIPEIRKGKVHEEILRTQTEKNIDLIVIAKHERKGLLTFLPGVTEKVKKKARCSVLMVGA